MLFFRVIMKGQKGSHLITSQKFYFQLLWLCDMFCVVVMLSLCFLLLNNAG